MNKQLYSYLRLNHFLRFPKLLALFLLPLGKDSKVSHKGFLRRISFLVSFLLIGFFALGQEVNCADGLDNDGDGFIDCSDSECGSSVDCPALPIGSLCSPSGGTRADLVQAYTEYTAPGDPAPSFSIPAGATSAIITISSHDSAIASPSALERVTDEDYLTMNVVVDLVNNTYSGYINQAKSTNTSSADVLLYGWQDLALGSAASTDAEPGHDDTPALNDLTISRVGNTLTVSQANTSIHSSYLVEFNSPNTNSLVGNGFETRFLSNGTAAINTDLSIPLPANTNTIELNMYGTNANVTNSSAGGTEEGFSNMKLVIDVDSGRVDGYVSVINGGDLDKRSTYILNDHPTGNTGPLSASPGAGGDFAAKSSIAGDIGIYTPNVYISGGNLIIERDAAYADDFDDVYIFQFFRRLTSPMSAEFISSETRFVPTGSGGLGTGEGRTFNIPSGTNFIYFRMSGNATNSVNEHNENAMAGFAVIDLQSEVANGYYYQQVGFSGSTRRDDNYAFENLPLDGTSSRGFAGSDGVFSSNPYDVWFDLSADKRQLTITNRSGLIPGDYQILLSCDYFGSKPDIAADPADVSFTAATCDTVTAEMVFCNPGSGVSAANMSVAFYDADPTVEDTAKLIAVDSLDSPLPIGACDTFEVRFDMSAYLPDVNRFITIVVNDNGSYAEGGLGTSVGTAFTLDSLAVQPGNTFNECDFSNNKMEKKIVLNVCGNNPPDAGGNERDTVFSDSTETIPNVLANNSDPDSDPLDIPSPPTASTQGGAVSYNPSDSTFTYTSPPSFVGTDTIIYAVCDGAPLCDNDSVFITIVTPEICDDGLDNDLDGLVDNFDPDCPCDSGNYFGQCRPDCEFDVSNYGDSIIVEEEWRSVDQVPSYGTPLVGDIDQDGVPEVVSLSNDNFTSTGRRCRNLRVLNGETGVQELLINTPYLPWSAFTPFVLGDIDGNGDIEIVVATHGLGNTGTDRSHLIAYNHDGTILWTSNNPYITDGSANNRFGATPALADFNHDGNVEVYIYNMIFRGSDGVLLADGGNTNSRGLGGLTNDGGQGFPSVTVAADVLPAQPGLELVAGNEVYQFVSNNTPGGSSLTIVSSVSGGNIRDGFTAVADVDGDDLLDVVVSKDGEPSASVGNQGIVYAWNPRTSTVLASAIPPEATVGGDPGWAGGGISLPCVGNMDNDATLDIVVTRARLLVAYEYDGTATLAQKWTYPNFDLSGATSVTLFDFNQDDIVEIVYRGQELLYILQEKGGNAIVKDTITCRSFTAFDMPVIADVNADGASEICVHCDQNDTRDYATISDPAPQGSYDNEGYVHLFKSPFLPFAPARQVWNQHNYFSVNVNDDLSIPRTQQNHALAFSGGKTLNNFLVQASTYDSTGTAFTRASDALVRLDYQLDTLVNYTVFNNATASSDIPENLSVVFYEGDPTQVGARLVGIDTVSTSIVPGDSVNVTGHILDSVTVGTLFAVVNNVGQVNPVDSANPNPGFIYPECDYTNNIDTIDAVNTPTFAAVDTVPVATPEDTPISICFSSISDPDGDEIDIVSQLSAPVFGTTSLFNTGDTCFTYAPNLNYNGPDTVEVLVCDTTGLCDTVVVPITVTPVNDAPVAVNDSIIIPEDTMGVVVDVQSNDSDIDGDPLTTTIIGGPNNGTALVLNGDSISYTPNTDYNGQDTVRYEVCDGGTPNLCDTALVIYTITPVNDAPDYPGNDTLPTTTPQDTPVAICLSSATDIDGDNFDVSSVITAPSNGTTSNVGSGDTCLTYTPNGGYNGPDTLIVTICDAGPLCDTVVVPITVTPVNDAPVAVNDSIIIPEDTTGVVVDVQVNDSDIDGDPLTTTIIGGPNNGTALVLNGDSISYTPNTDYNGQDTVRYEVCDGGTPNLCDTALVIYTITPVNDAPDYPGNDTLPTTTPQDTPVAICLSSATDIDGDNFDVSSVITAPSNGTTSNVGSGDTCLTYTPNGGYNGPDTLIVTICDAGPLCDTVVVPITVTPVNDAPVAVNDSIIIPEDTMGVVVDVQSNDSDIDGDPLTTTIIGGPNNGTALVLNGDSISYTPNTDYNGQDTVRYEVCDGGTPNLCDTALVIYTITPVNDAPDYPGNDTLPTTTPQDTPVAICLSSATDIDGDNFDVSSVITAPSNGTTSNVGSGDTCLTYTPNGGYNGPDTLIVTICDAGPLCDTVVVPITVTPVNDAPVAVNDSIIIPEDTTGVVVDVQVNDSDIDGDPLTTTIIGGPNNGTALVLNGDSISYTPNTDYNGQDTVRYEVCDGGTPNLCDTALVIYTITPVNDAPDYPGNDTLPTTTPQDTPVAICLSSATDIDGDNFDVSSVITAPSNGTTSNVGSGDTCLTYTPNGGYNGPDTLIVTICDAGPLCDTVVVPITVTPVNDAPVAVNDSIIIPEDTTGVVVDVQSNDSDIDGDPLTTTIIGGPNNGTALVLNGDSISYTPNTDYNGQDTVRYEVCDGGTPNLCDTALVIYTITPVNDAPDYPGNDTLPTTTPQDTPVAICLSSATDIDGDNFDVSSVITAPSNGTTSNVGTGDTCLTYTPNGGYNGPDTLIVTICDAGPLCDTVVVPITVTPVNDAPVAVNDSIIIPEDTTGVVVDVQVNDSDIDGDPLTTTIIGGPNNGTALVLNGDSISYTPNTDYNGQDTVRYEVCDGGTPNLCDTALVIYTITPVNDAPDYPGNDTLPTTTPQDTPVAICLSSATDIDGDNFDVSSVITAPSNGTTSNVGSGDTCLTYTPNGGYNGPDTLIVTICDAGPLCDTVVVPITVTPVNDAPVAVNDSIIIPEDTTGVVVDVQSNDSDIDGDPLTTTIIGGPNNGTALVLNGDSISYTPNTDYNGQDTVRYEVCDGGTPNLCDTALVIYTITPVNDAPDYPGNDSLPTTTPEDTPVAICLSSATDIDGDNFDVSSVITAPSNGTTSNVGSGDTCLTYTPNGGYNGPDTLIVTICDAGPLCDTVVVPITVTPVNDAPVAVNDSIIIPEDTMGVVVDVQSNDSDIDGDPLTTTIIGGPNNGTALVLNGDSISYTPNTDYNGQDTVRYEVCDGGTPNLCDTALVIYTITPVNDAPDYPGNDTLPTTTPQDTPVAICLSSATDIDGDNFDVSSVITAPSNGTTSNVGSGDTCLTYTPNGGYNGPDTLIVTICDAGPLCDTVVVPITVTPVNDAPVAVNDSIIIPEDTTGVVVDVQSNDSDIDGDPLTTTIIGGPNNGTALVLNGDSISYTPNTDYNGQDTVRYEVCDGGTPNLCDTALVIYTITPVNDAPDYPGNDTLPTTTPQDTPVAICLSSATDIDGDNFDVSSVITAPSNGTTSNVGSGDTCLTYTPNGGYNGPDTLIVTICDAGPLCDTVVVPITVTPVNDAPVAVNDSIIIPEDTMGVVVDVQSNDSDIDGDPLTTTIIGGPNNGTALVLNGDSISYTPNTDYNGQDTVRYEVCDGGTPNLCDTALVIYTITPVNDAPDYPGNDTLPTTTPQDTPVAICLSSATDIDGDNFDVSSVITAPSNGTTSNVGSGDTCLTYTPNGGYNGPDTLIVTICDAGPLCDTVVVPITVTPVNDAPVAVNDSIIIPEDTTGVVVDVQVNDSDIDGDPLTTTIIGGPNNGTALVLNGDSISYTPNTDYNGQDTVRYEVCDGGTPNLCDTALVIYTITPVNDAPDYPGNDTLPTTTPQDTPVAICLSSATDIDGDNFDVSSVITAPSNGTTSNVGSGDTCLTYTPNGGYNGPDTLIVTICDAGPLCDTVVVPITVTPVNDAPVAVNDSIIIPEDTTGVVVDVQVNDSDIDGDPLTTTIIGGPNNGTALVLNGDSISYTPNTDYNGQDTVRYEVCDGGTPNLCDTALVIYTITPVNDAPDYPGNDTLPTTTPQDTPVAICLSSATDIDGDNFDVSSVITAPSNGTTSNVGSGDTCLTYTPNGGYNGPDTLIVTICDAGPLCDTVVVPITVTPVNDAPVAVNDSIIIPEDTTGVVVDVQVNDSDIDGDPLTTTIIGGPNNGTALVLNGDSISYTPNTDYNGQDTVRYEVCDGGTPNLCDTALVIYTITPVNDAPDYPGNDTLPTTTPQDTPVAICLSSATDIDGDNFDVSSVITAPSNGTTSNVGSGDTCLTYTPNGGYNGPDTLIVTICDAGPLCDTVVVPITVTPVNDAPVAVNDSIIIPEDTTGVVVDVQVNDSDIDGDPLTTTIIGGPNNGTALVLNGDSISYTPNTDYNGQDTVRYEVCDGGTPNLCDTALVIYTITPVNDAPDYPGNDTLPTTTPQDTPVAICLSSATDIDGDNFDVSSVITAPSNGTTSNVGSGDTCLTYTPNGGYNGPDTLIVTICDAGPLCDTVVVPITVTPVNDAPVAVNDSIIIPEDTTGVVVDVQVNDSDIDGDPLTTTIIGGPNNGTALVLNGDSISYTPNTDYNGQDTVRYEVCDGGTPNLCDTALVIYTITPVNDAPDYPGNDTLPTTTPQDTPVAICLSSATDIDGDNFDVSSVITAPSNGTTSNVGSGDTCLTYTPNGGYNGPDTLIVTICDAGPLCDTVVVPITVTPVNDAPVAVNDSIIIPEDTTGVVVDVQVNDSDIDGDPLTTTIIGGPNNGTALVLNGDSISYTPNTDYNGQDTVRYEVCDGGTPNLCDTALVIYTITPVNDAPDYPGNDTLPTTTPQDTPVAICLSSATDIDGDNFDVSSVITAPSNGTTSNVGSGDTCLTYTPNGGYNGPDTLIVTICDAGPLCDTVVVPITVTPVNDAPVAVNDSIIIPEDTTGVVVDVQSNDSDIDGDPLTTTIIGGPNNGTALVLNGDSISYTPNTDYNGQDTVRYEVCDGGTPNLCDTALVIYTITPVNDAPDYPGNDTLPTTTPQDTPVAICLSSATDIDGDNFDVSSVITAPSNGTTSNVGSGDTCLTYTPNGGYNGPDTLIVTICDAGPLCDTVVVPITVTPVNDAPVAVNDSIIIPEDTTGVVVDVQVNDSDIDGDPLTTTIIGGPNNGTALVLNGDSISYTPNTDYNGQDTVRYEVCDGGTPNLCDTALVIYTITPVNDAPDYPGNDTLPTTTPQDTPVAICLSSATDIDGDNFDVSSVITAPSNGTTSNVGSGDTCLTYTPNGGYNGPDTLIVTICDAGPLCDTVVVPITVTPVNDAPVAVNDSIIIPEDTTGVVVDVQSNDSDIDGDPLTTTIIGGPNNGTALVLNGDSISYTPNTDYNGQDTVRYEVCDGGTPNLCDTALVIYTITPVNDAPDYPGNDTLPTTTPQDTPVAICLSSATDIDGDNFDVSSVITAPSNGTTSNVGSGDTCLTYTPNGGYNGPDTLIVTICDAGPLCDTVVVPITVTPVNDAPVAVNDSIIIPEDTMGVVVDVQSNDSDIDGDPLTTTIIGGPNNGTALVLNGDSISYTPNTDYNGQDTVRYEVCDGGTPNLCDTALVIYTITPVNDAPDYPGNDTLPTTTPQDTPVAICLSSATDIDGDNFDVSSVITAPSNGTTSNVGSGDTCLTYTPNGGYNGPDTLIVTICDAGPLCDTVVVPITVTPVNDAPVAVNDSIIIPEDTMGVVVDVQSNDSDIDGDPLTTTIIGGPNNGTALVLNGDSISYTPNTDYNGQDTVRYEVCDGGTPNLCDTALVIYTITPVNDAPDYPGNDTLPTTTPQDTPVAICLSSATDIDGDNFDVSSVITAPSNGTTSNVGSGDTCLTYTPNGGYNGPDTLIVTICDAGPLCDTVVVPITVTPVNDAPVAVNDSIIIPEDTTGVVVDVQVNDSDIDGDPLTTTIIGGPNNGTALVLNGDSISYTPNTDYNGQDTVRYEVCDGGTPNLCDTAWVIIEVRPVNDPPLAQDILLSTIEDEPVDTMMLDFVSDIDDSDSSLTIRILSALGEPDAFVEGEWSYDAETRTFSFDPAPGFTASIEMFYTVCDTSGLCDTARIVVEIDPSGNEPIPAEGFTPEDERYWLIKNINEYPDNHVSLFNRYGHLIFETEGYVNNVNAWDGRSNKGIRFGGDLVPDGTYFYVIEYEDNGETKLLKGFIEVLN